MFLETPKAENRITGTGEMADRIRAHDWSATDLGGIETWSEAMVTSINLMLASPVSTNMYLGEQCRIFYNDPYRSFLEGKHPDVMGKPAVEVWPEAWKELGPVIEGTSREGHVTHMVETYLPIKINGKLEDRWFTYVCYPIFDRGRPIGAYSPALDVTETRTMRLALESSFQEAYRTNEKLKLAMELAGQGSFFYDETTRNITVDPGTRDLFELPSLSGPAEYWISKVHPDDQQRVAEAFAQAASDKGSYDLEHRVVRSDGVRWLQARARRISEPGAPIVLTGICEDITKRRAEEENKRLILERLHLAQKVGHIASWDWILSTGQILWNDSEWSYGRPAEEVNTPEKCFAHIYPEDRAAVQEALAPSFESTVEYFCEFRTQWPDNSIHWIVGRGQGVFPDANGKPTRVIGVNVDVTERRLSEAALMQSEKLAAVGRLASSVSHEINNPLEAVANLLYIVKGSENLSQSDRDYLEAAERELSRVAHITTQTLRFHRQSTAPTEMDPKKLFEEVLSLYATRLQGSSVTVVPDFGENVHVTCYEGDIRQVLNNLVANAFDAMRQGGRLWLRTRNRTDWSTGRNGVMLTVADNGSGMDEATRKRVFEAFYSTKGIHGNGLGLWISKRIVHKHRGHLCMRSSTGEHHGTVFQLWLPCELAETAKDAWHLEKPQAELQEA